MWIYYICAALFVKSACQAENTGCISNMIYFYSYSKRWSLNNFGISWTVVIHIHVFSRSRQPETPHSQNWLSYVLSAPEVCLLWVVFLSISCLGFNFSLKFSHVWRPQLYKNDPFKLLPHVNWTAKHSPLYPRLQTSRHKNITSGQLHFEYWSDTDCNFSEFACLLVLS